MCARIRSFLIIAIYLGSCAVAPAAGVVDVNDDASLRTALGGAGPGTVIRMASGRYQPGVFAAGLKGTRERPIVIEGGEPGRPPLFEGGKVAWQLSDCEYLTLRNLTAHTRPETFTFADNLWYCEDRPEASRPDLPVAERGGLYGVDPRLKSLEDGRFRPENAQAGKYGDLAWPGPAAER